MSARAHRAVQWAALTGMVPAASGRAPPPPHAVVRHRVPVAESFLTQSVRRQVTDFYARKLLLELIKRHPGKLK